MPIDTHVHLAAGDTDAYPRPENPPISTVSYTNDAEQFIADMDGAAVDGAIVVQPFGIYGYDNAYHADSAARFPERFVAVGGLSTSVEDAPAVLREWVTKRGIAGLRLNTRPGDTDFDHPQFGPLVEEAARLAVPICFLTSLSVVPRIHALALRMPALRIALDHLGGQLGEPDRVLSVLAELKPATNITLKFSTPVFAEGTPAHREMFGKIVSMFGVDRLMWGTNYPVTNLGSYKKTVDAGLEGLDSFSKTDRYELVSGTALRMWPQLRGRVKGEE
jgi:predicted TIM-barrel fold metal-dependent hydrolase